MRYRDITTPRIHPFATPYQVMENALAFFIYFYCNMVYRFGEGTYNTFLLPVVYQSVLQLIEDPRLNGQGVEIFKRIAFILRNVHCAHCMVRIFPTQIASVAQRRLAVCMSQHRRLGSDSMMRLLDDMTILRITVQSSDDLNWGDNVLSWESYFIIVRDIPVLQAAVRRRLLLAGAIDA